MVDNREAVRSIKKLVDWIIWITSNGGLQWKRFDADPDPSFYFDGDPDPALKLDLVINWQIGYRIKGKGLLIILAVTYRSIDPNPPLPPGKPPPTITVTGPFVASRSASQSTNRRPFCSRRNIGRLAGERPCRAAHHATTARPVVPTPSQNVSCWRVGFSVRMNILIMGCFFWK